MEGTRKSILRKTSVKWLLIFFTVAAVTACGVLFSGLFLIEDQGYDIFNSKRNYEETSHFYNTLYRNMDTILDCAEEKTSEQQRIMYRYLKDKTNLSYILLYPEERKYYTNIGKFPVYETAAKDLEKMQTEDWYLIIGNSRDEYAASNEIDFSEIYWMLNEHTSRTFTLAVSLDLDYPIQDEFASGCRTYKFIHEYMPLMIAGIVVCTFLAIFFLILLTKAAGRKQEDEEIHLNWLDNIYTEIAALGVLVIWLSGLAVIGETAFRYNYNNKEYILLGIGILAFYTICWFLIGYLSLVRRIKAKTLWEKSIFRAGKNGSVKLIGTGFGWGRKIIQKYSKYPKQFFSKFYRGGKKAGKLGYRFLKEGFLDNMSDLAKLCLIFALLFLFRLCLNVAEVNRSGIAFLMMIVLDLAICSGLLYYSASELRIKKGIREISEGSLDTKIDENGLIGYQREMAQTVNQIAEGMQKAIQQSLKDERMKTELITNVSHDIKTPLTSIINYVDLLKRENIQDPKVQSYIEILEEKSQRLKILTEDVVEASRASTGNVTLEMMDLDLVELIWQVKGEYEERLKENDLIPVFSLPSEPVLIHADGRRMWRILSNLFGNIAKYSLEGTRVYADLRSEDGKAELTMKNISRDSLNISAEELTERFVRGDQSRTTEGSGLGLSIAKSFTELMGGSLLIRLDGDLFKVILTFPLASLGK